MKIDKKIALITGAAAGLSRELAKGFARAGAHLLIADIDAGAAKSVAALVRAEGRYAWLISLAHARRSSEGASLQPRSRSPAGVGIDRLTHGPRSLRRSSAIVP